MTEKQKTQLSKLYLRVTALTIILVAFFIYATFYNTSFFYYLIGSFVVVILYLSPLRGRLVRGKAYHELTIQDIREKSNLVEEDIKHEQGVIQSFREKIVSFYQLKDLTEKLSLSLRLDDTSRTLVAEVNKLFGDDDTTIIIYLFHSKTGDLGISSSQKGQMRVNLKSKKGDIFDQWVVKTMHPLLVEDAKSDFRFDMDKVARDDRDVRAVISIPLMVGEKALGILRVDSSQENSFDTEDLRFLTTIGDLGAVAIENAQLYEQVEQLAIKDSLTNLYLRRYLTERMPEEVARHVRSGGTLSFLMMDLDHFKEYNDKFGHMAGDIVLRTVGMILSDFFKEPGTLVCRYGGEEFAVLLPECSKKKATELAEAVRKKIADQPVLLRREKTKITISVGVATFPQDAKIREEIIHQADQALYKAKKEGRNRVVAA